jgi:hypothetical protein
MNRIVATILALMVIGYASAAYPLTGLEFYVRCQQVGINTVDPMFQIVQSLVYEWIKQEYRNVPTAMQLSSWVLDAVRQKGWGNRELKDICLDVALENGMVKPK